ARRPPVEPVFRAPCLQSKHSINHAKDPLYATEPQVPAVSSAKGFGAGQLAQLKIQQLLQLLMEPDQSDERHDHARPGRPAGPMSGHGSVFREPYIPREQNQGSSAAQIEIIGYLP